METIKIIDQYKQIEQEREKLTKKLEHLNLEEQQLSKMCSHDIVFKYVDKHPRKMVIDGNYYCPACGKIKQFTSMNQYLTSEFKDSKVVSLTDLSLIGDVETLKTIREEVIDNFDFYYKCSDGYELRNRMENKLKDHQHKYEKILKMKSKQ